MGGPSSCEELEESGICDSANVKASEPSPQVNSDDTIFHADHVRSAGGKSVFHPLAKTKNCEDNSSSGDESIVPIYTDGAKLSSMAPKKRQSDISNVL